MSICHPIFLCPVSVINAHSTTGASQDSCSSLQRYITLHNCYNPGQIFNKNSCSLHIICTYNDLLVEVLVKECADPVSVTVHYILYGGTEFKYVFGHSETVTNGDSGNYTGIVARNASHTGFEVHYSI